MMDVYQQLRERLDMFPQGFPPTRSGVEIDILKKLFSPEEAEIMLYLRPYPEEPSTPAARMGRDVKELSDKLYDMSKRGLILRGVVGDQTFYLMAPWMVGIWEFQVSALDMESIELYERYFEEGFVPYRVKNKTPGFRVIPIERAIEGGTEVQSFEMVSEIIESASRFAVADCICRKEAHLLGRGCDKLVEACMMFDLAADYYIENGLGREITKEESLELLRKTEESGLVHCSGNHKDKKMFICNCCGCCCKALGMITRYNHPSAIAKSNYLVKIDHETCIGCAICLERCQVGALSIEDDVARLDPGRCIGCGLCVSTCPTESMIMVAKSPEECNPVFSDQTALLSTLGGERNKSWPFE